MNATEGKTGEKTAIAAEGAAGGNEGGGRGVAGAEAAAPAEGGAGGAPERRRFDFSKLLAIGVLFLLYVFFCFAGNNFRSTSALVAILDSSYYIGFMAIGVTFAIITAGIDLSIGTVMMSSALIGGVAYSAWGMPIFAALLVGGATGTAFGALNGLLVTRGGIVPFVATLGIQMVASGFGSIVSKVTTQRFPAAGTPDGVFKQVLYKIYGTGSPLDGFPMGIVWLALFYAVGWVLLNRTRLGRYTYAIGSNEEATRLSGINVGKWKLIVYTIVGAYAGMAGVMYAAAYTSIVPGTGAGMEILGIAAVFIGGTSVSGGSGTLSGTMIGVYIMAVLKQGLMSMGLQGHYQTFFTGIVVVAAVMLDNYRTRRGGLAK